MSVSYASNRVTINSYKNGSVLSNSTTNLQITSGEILSGDIGRFVAVYPSSSNSALTQVRRIISVSGGTIGINSPWVGTIASGVTWRVSHNCEDVHAIGSADLQKVGTSTYRWNADWSISSSGFFADADITLEMTRSNTTSWPIASGGVVQFGVLYGGEANGAKETTNGCRLEFRQLASNTNVYSSVNARVGDGGVVNYYGCLIESYTSTWMFQRMNGPTRFIGCIFDGVMGGRFYHEGSEWVDCRMSGNDNTTPAWSIGATFTRDIESIKSYRNLMSMKSYQAFGGNLRIVEFSNNTSIFNRQANSSASVFRFIDCTEFDTPDTISSGGTVEQYRSVVLRITDSTGSDLAGAVIRVNDSSDTTQGSTQVSDVNGDVAEIIALRYKWVHGITTRNSYFPFRIRVRKFGYYYVSLPTPIEDPIKQSLAMLSDPNVAQASGTASAHTGITVTDHGGSPVSWQSKNWGITITGSTVANPSLTAEDIKHYLHYHLSQDATFMGKSSGLLWHNLVPMAGMVTERGSYGGTNKGVRVVNENGDPFPGFTQMQADDGTFYIPPIQYSFTLNGLQPNSEVRIYLSGTSTELIGVENSGTSFTYNYQYSGDFNIDYIVFNLGYLPIRVTGITLGGQNSSVLIQQTIDRQYLNP
jgi:hypothetical protein